MPPINFQRGLLALGVVVITACGAFAGATYRADTQSQKEAEQIREETTGETIARLRKTRDHLVARRREIASKIECAQQR
ncbi:hypothetical protein TWF694_002214 [Orbilia ellipsospora]|uniref:Uncharacterized protein n=1 Tax=Orbilia ellipsospora TaxID=2528407 RepID=A0AAV9X1D5_9PEZI